MSTLTIGADPEFVAAHCAQGKWKWGEVGLDGAGMPTFELRPEPSTRAEEVVQNIAELLGRAANCHTQPVAGYAGPYAFNRPLGGHVHLGHPLLREDSETCRDLADVLGGLLSPIVFVAGGERCAARREDDYGYPNDFRTQPHGMEWRAPFSWLWDPDLARDILWLTGVVADLFLTHRDESILLRPGKYDDIIEDIDQLLRDSGALDDIRRIAEKSVSNLGQLATELVGGEFADEVVACANRILEFEPLPYYANIFARWNIDSRVTAAVVSRWEIDWMYDLGVELAQAVGAYRVIFYGIAQHREGARLSCVGLNLGRELTGWEMIGYGRYGCVPDGVIAIGIPWGLREDGSAAGIVQNAVKELIDAAKSDGTLEGDDYEFYRRLYDEYQRGEEEEYIEEEEEEELEVEEEGDNEEDQNTVFQPFLLIPTSCYLNL